MKETLDWLVGFIAILTASCLAIGAIVVLMLILKGLPLSLLATPFVVLFLILACLIFIFGMNILRGK